ncbi:sugar phosphate isomerase/epimerase [Vallitaleaceae bacterium 9-2]
MNQRKQERRCTSKMMTLGRIAGAQEQAFIEAKRIGLDFLEFTVDIGDDGEEFVAKVDQLKQWSEETGVGIGSVGRWKTDRIDEAGDVIEEELQICFNLIDAAAALGCSNFVSGCNYIQSRSYLDNCLSAIDFYSRLIAYGAKKNVRISSATCYKNNFVNNPTAWQVIHGHLPELGIKYDPSHRIYAGEDYLQEVKDWGHRFYHVHLKGSFAMGGERIDEPIPGMDQTNWQLFMSLLYAKGYDAGLSIEPHSSYITGKREVKSIEFTVNYFKKMLF